MYGPIRQNATNACAFEHAGNAKVAQLDDITLGQEDVLRLEIAVQNFAVVDVLERKRNLDKLWKAEVGKEKGRGKQHSSHTNPHADTNPVDDLVLREAGAQLGLGIDTRKQVAAIAVVHHNVQVTGLFERVAVPVGKNEKKKKKKKKKRKKKEKVGPTAATPSARQRTRQC